MGESGRKRGSHEESVYIISDERKESKVIEAERKFWFKTIADSPETIKVVITPEIAEALIDCCYEEQRPRARKTVDRYILDMKEGKWNWAASDSIKLDRQGRVIDGQHRLWAVFMSGVAIQSWVTIGLDTDAYHVIDTGKARRATDVLGRVKNRSIVGAIVRFRILWDRGERLSVLSKSVTNAEVATYFENHPEIASHAIRAQKIYKQTRISAAAVGSFISLAYDYNPFKAAEFVSCLEDGAGLLKGNPALEVRNRLMRENSGKTKFNRLTSIVFLIKAFNLYLKGQSVGVFKYLDGEKFPEIGE
jgi:hypothetical protein